MSKKRKPGAELRGTWMVVNSGLQECPHPECELHTGKGSLNIYLACPYHFEVFCPMSERLNNDDDHFLTDADDYDPDDYPSLDDNDEEGNGMKEYGKYSYLPAEDYDDKIKEEIVELIKKDLRDNVDAEILEDTWKVVVNDYYEFKAIGVKVMAKEVNK